MILLEATVSFVFFNSVGTSQSTDSLFLSFPFPFPVGREYQTIEYANYVLSFPYLAIYQWVCSFLS